MRRTRGRGFLAASLVLAVLALTFAALAPAALAQEGGGHHAGGEANLQLPDLRAVAFAGGLNGHTLLLFGLLVCALGWAFGIMTSDGSGSERPGRLD